jgi:HAD superfamily hydrolase (TIGR01509 family)
MSHEASRGVILDMDGLMLDTERMETDLYVTISREMGWPTAEEFLRTTIGLSEDSAEAVYRAEFGAAYPYREIWRKVREGLAETAEHRGIPHRPGLAAFLDRLTALEIPAAVATSSVREMALWKLEKGGIAGRFAALACGDEVEWGKPAPDIFLLAARRLGLEPADCIGFEDSPAGLRGLAAAGIRAVFIKDLAEPPPEVLRTIWRRYGDLAEAAELF